MSSCLRNQIVLVHAKPENTRRSLSRTPRLGLAKACTALQPQGPGTSQDWPRLQCRRGHAPRSQLNDRIRDPAFDIRSFASRTRQARVPARRELISSREGVVSKSYLFPPARPPEMRLCFGYASKEAADK